ncbi:PREDICTED: transcription factor DIVARICATA-like [Camelina sativa]|uniref:Transcription factor DIVARICATA-like n=1 Tax=Camelina sativa TaxID=90675 RepID=A0ABM0SZZ1_CAMSA|nr:PREDICTED: transcription factor DIVARICATA-like [Camelina sativa]
MASIPQWTWDEHKRFEIAVAQSLVDSSSSLENIAKLLKKPFEEVKYYYEALVYDVGMIESDNIALPKYRDDDYVSLKEARKPIHIIKGRFWTEEEHRLFLAGLNKYGKGEWKMISREFVKTKNHMQVATHAQKYYKRQQLGSKKKRSTILDITLESITGKPDFGMHNPPHDDDHPPSRGSCLGPEMCKE